MGIKLTNNASATLASSITNSATSISLTTGQGASFPALSAGDFFYATLVDSSNNLEIIKVTARSADVLTVVRAQDNTTARAYAAGDKFELRAVAAVFSEFVQITGAQTIAGVKTFSDGVVANVTGNVTGDLSGNAGTVTNGVYTTGTQTIGGSKTFSSAINVSLTGANSLTSTLTTGVDDVNFRLGSMNGIAGSTGASQGKFGLFYMGVGESATIDFRRGASTTDGSIAFRTAGTDRATLDNSGNFTATGNVTAYSDERVKTNWRPVKHDFVGALAYVKSGVYDRIDVEATQVGVSAQSLQQVLPEAVLEDVEGNLSVAYGNAALVAAVELAKEVVQLKARIEALETK